MKDRILVGTIGVIILVMGLFFFYFHNWDDSVASGGDSWGYYTYLPSTFIHHDLKDLSEVIIVRKNDHPETVFLDDENQHKVSEATNTPHGRVIKYTYGLSVFYLPAFGLSHIYAMISSQYEPDGYSIPYIFGLYVISLLYILLGLVCVWKIVEKYFNRKIASLCILIIGLGTNLFYFGVLNNVMAHSILFFLWALTVYYSDKYWTEQRSYQFLVATTACAFISLIRPSEVICYLIPLLWNMSGWRSRLGMLMNKRLLLIYSGFIGFIIVGLQLSYWKYSSGQWVFDSYPGEGFQFDDPHIWEGLVGFMNGWLPYSPLMVLSVIGMLMMLRSTLSIKWLIITLFLLHVYIIYSWWNWYYINGFGSRPMVDIYAVLSLPLAYLLFKIRSNVLKVVGSTVVLLLVSLNIFQTYQHSKGILWTELGNLGYYLQVFGQTEFDKKMSIALDMNEFQKSDYHTIDTLYYNGFEERMYQFTSDSIFRSGEYGYHIEYSSDQDIGFIELPYEEIFKDQEKTFSHFYLSLDIYVEEQITSFYEFETLILEYVRENGKVYKRRYLRLNNKPGKSENMSLWWGEPRIWDTVGSGFRISSRFKEGHKFRMFFHKINKRSSVYVDNLTLMSSTK